MVRIIDWTNERHEISVKKVAPLLISFFSVLLFTSMSYYDNFYTIKSYENIFLIIVIIWIPLLLIGIILSFKKEDLGTSLMTIALATFFPLMIAVSRRMIWIEFFFLVLIIVGIVLVYKRNQLELLIKVRNRTSLIFYRALINEVKKKLTQKKFNFTMKGDIFSLIFPDGRKGSLFLEMKNGPRRKYYYKVVFRSKTKSTQAEVLKDLIKNTVLKLDQEKRIHTYPNNE